MLMEPNTLKEFGEVRSILNRTVGLEQLVELVEITYQISYKHEDEFRSAFVPYLLAETPRRVTDKVLVEYLLGCMSEMTLLSMLLDLSSDSMD